jgi:hypothetical protein
VLVVVLDENEEPCKEVRYDSSARGIVKRKYFPSNFLLDPNLVYSTKVLNDLRKNEEEINGL